MSFWPQASPQRTHEKPSVKLLQVQDIAHMNRQISWWCEMLVETSNSSDMGKKDLKFSAVTSQLKRETFRTRRKRPMCLL